MELGARTSLEVVSRPSLGLNLCVELRRPILEIYNRYYCGWPPQSALILNPIEGLETTSMNYFDRFDRYFIYEVPKVKDSAFSAIIIYKYVETTNHRNGISTRKICMKCS